MSFSRSGAHAGGGGRSSSSGVGGGGGGAAAAAFDVDVEALRTLMEARAADAVEKLQEDYGGTHGLIHRLRTDPINGLSGDADDLAKRREAFGSNEIPPHPPKSFLTLVWEALQDVTLIILLISAVVSLALSFYRPPEEAGGK